MATDASHKPPQRDRETLIVPPYAEWAALVRSNVSAAAGWPGDLTRARREARAEIVRAAEEYSRSIGLPATSPEDDGAPLVLSGHQPEFVHPGVWAKMFLLERLVRDTGARGINLVVDTDVAGRLAFKAPCLDPVPSACEISLGDLAPGATWSQLPVPDAPARAAFRRRGAEVLGALGVCVFGARFAALCDELDRAAESTRDLGSAITMARRGYEAPAGTAYRELPVSVLCRTAAFRRFAAGILLDAAAFRHVMNSALGEYRASARVRSAAQPFPDLAHEADRIEVPFWLVRGVERLPVSVDASGCLCAGAEAVLQLPHLAESAAEALAAQDVLLAPRALTLTLFARVFLGDLFIHGTGGGRYDRITDAVIERYFGVRAPGYCVASMSLLLPLGIAATTDEDVASAERRLKRFEHNPDEMLAQAAFLSAAERERAEALAAQKADLVGALGAPDADRKMLGLAVREVNAALADVLRPLEALLRADLERVRAARDAWAVLGDRTYPFFLWDPLEVAAEVW